MIESLPDWSLADCRTKNCSKIEEFDRLGPGVGLLSYEDESEIPQKPASLHIARDKVNILQNLPLHPNIVE